MMKFNSNFVNICRQYCGKWNVPKELLSTSISSEEGMKENPESGVMRELLRGKFPKAEKIEVTDLSGNCGSMFEVLVVSEDFKELPLVKQHMLVTEVLSEHIKNMHGITIETKVPDKTAKTPT